MIPGDCLNPHLGGGLFISGETVLEVPCGHISEINRQCAAIAFSDLLAVFDSFSHVITDSQQGNRAAGVLGVAHHLGQVVTQSGSAIEAIQKRLSDHRLSMGDSIGLRILPTKEISARVDDCSPIAISAEMDLRCTAVPLKLVNGLAVGFAG